MPESRLRWVVFFLLAVATSFSEDLSSIPKPTGYVSDVANVISAPDKAELEDFCGKVQQQLGAQFAILTIKTLDGQPIENFSIDLARKWGIGPRSDNEGLLILLVVQDHKQRIEVGRGLEPYITDGFTGETERDMRPLLRASDFGGALKQSTMALATHLAQGKNIPFSNALSVPPRPQTEPQEDNGGHFPLAVILFLVVLVLVGFLNRRGGGGRGTGSGFWTGMILSGLLNSGRGGGRGGGGWGGGGGFGGGSGGGGGFGGFGGGDFGGGGASSDW